MLSLDNTCPQCGKSDWHQFADNPTQSGEQIIVAARCGFCHLTNRTKLCPRVAQSILSCVVFEPHELSMEMLSVILTGCSVVPTSGPVADRVGGALLRLLSIDSYENEPHTHTAVIETPFGELVWFAAMYGHRFVTLGLLRSLLDRSVVPAGSGTTSPGEGA